MHSFHALLQLRAKQTARLLPYNVKGASKLQAFEVRSLKCKSCKINKNQFAYILAFLSAKKTGAWKGKPKRFFVDPKEVEIAKMVLISFEDLKKINIFCLKHKVMA